MRNDLPELLAPAGGFPALEAAIEAGADAVYFGGENFGARAFAKKPGRDRRGGKALPRLRREELCDAQHAGV